MERIYKGPIPGRIISFDYDEKQKMDHYCCDLMHLYHTQKEKIILYFPITREIAFKISDTIFQKINFCPWCGCKLLIDLREEFFKQVTALLREELGIEAFSDPRLPEEFKTDEWWKKRGL